MMPEAYDQTPFPGQAGSLIGELSEGRPARSDTQTEFPVGRPGRSLCIYPAREGYELQRELDFLANRVMEANVFFTGRFLAPAMPRLEERPVRMLLIRDRSERRSRLRFVMPFTVEKPGFTVGPSIIRVWSHSLGPLGTPMVDAEGAAETLDNLLDGLADRRASMPSVLVLPDMRLDGEVTSLLRVVALSRGLPVETLDRVARPVLGVHDDAGTFLKETVSRSTLKEMRRQWRLLESRGRLAYEVVRRPSEVRAGLEAFFVLESAGWKGRQKSALVSDKYRAAFTREAVHNLAETDNVRIHLLTLDGAPIAAMIVFVIAGEAYTWKTAYDEEFAAFSPGKQLFLRLTEQHIDDANIMRTDSCAVPDHPMAGRLWSERCEMGTLIVGLGPEKDREVRQVARQLHLYRNTRNLARLLRDRLRQAARRKVAERRRS